MNTITIPAEVAEQEPNIVAQTPLPRVESPAEQPLSIQQGETQ